jgi:endonuclease/exonuclease/phosphatase (EEP) superfamily protein YafD
MRRAKAQLLVIGVLLLLAGGGSSRAGQVRPRGEVPPVARFGFDGSIRNATGPAVAGTMGDGAAFGEGLEGDALRLTTGDAAALVSLDGAGLPFDSGDDFSVQFWVRTSAGPERRMVLLSQKSFVDNSLAMQKQAGWVFYASGGTWAWNMGSGDRRISYERDNGAHMPLNDGRWHQLTMTYDAARAEVRLYYDGRNRAIYNVSDSVGFDFTSADPLVAGWAGTEASPQADIVPAIHAGAAKLQQLVDELARLAAPLGLEAVASEEFVRLIAEPRELFEDKVRRAATRPGADREAVLAAAQSADFAALEAIESELMDNPYTIHQVVNFMETAPAMKIYSLVDGRVTIDEVAARAFTERERLYPSDFDIDELVIWDRPLAPEEVLDAYAAYFEPVVADAEQQLSSLTAGAWNIFHGGKHFTVDEHGWDSRSAIARIIERENVDVLMMQETYSAGDFIAAELGYYFATTVDWDYLNQGSNISVLSRYPIAEVQVEPDSPFMNVGTRIAISATQDIYVMSNWYGMQQFAAVFDFHRQRFAESDTVPTLFGGDFNAVPHTDGGDSPASPVLLGAGFTDAFRSLHPDVQAYPGATHRNGRRIDQLYYKGAGLRNAATHLVTTWPTGFPSDHNLIVAKFDLDYASSAAR